MCVTTKQEIKGVNKAAMKKAERKWRSQILPPRGLGYLEDIAIQLAGIWGTTKPSVSRKIVFMYCADHGVAVEGVSTLPLDLTRRLMELSGEGSTAIGVICDQLGIDLVPVDVGVRGQPGKETRVVRKPVKAGTGNIRACEAMSAEECIQAISVGREVVAGAGVQSGSLVGIGEIGVANTTTASALMSALLGMDLAETVGRGSGVSDTILEWKRQVITDALLKHEPNRDDWLDCTCKVGGFEIAAMTGGILEAAERGCGVVLDGFTSTISALLAMRIAPVRPYLFFSHLSHERGHLRLLEELDGHPILDLDMGLGEGTGAALAMPIIETSARILSSMAILAI